MDSLTQIVLGAACGEAVLGKKIGNKALLFGAIGGTIPDLDVFVSAVLFDNEIQSMAFHRGFMHSILFSIIGAFVFGWLVYKLYNKGKRSGSTTLKDWQKLFFWSLFTHPILDSFTPYGTQLFYPFTDYRVAVNNIAVADFFYTIPFLLALIILMFYKRDTVKRRWWLKIGLGVSSLYMLFTLGNKLYIDSVFQNSLLEQNIGFNRFRTQPAIFSSFLWYGVAETDTAYYMGFYSLFDKENRVKDWQIIKKEQQDIPLTDEDISTLLWFSDGFYHISPSGEKGVYVFKDLRYALLDPDDKNSSLFTFKIFKNNGRWDMKNSRPEVDEGITLQEIFGPMIKRLKGI